MSFRGGGGGGGGGREEGEEEEDEEEGEEETNISSRAERKAAATGLQSKGRISTVQKTHDATQGGTDRETTRIEQDIRQQDGWTTRLGLNGTIINLDHVWVHVYIYIYVCACVCACVPACVRACANGCVCVRGSRSR